MNGPKIYFYSSDPGRHPHHADRGILVCGYADPLHRRHCTGTQPAKRPGRRQVLVEKGVSMLYGMVEDTMGKHNAYWTPYIGALFLSSLFGTLIGMTGILRSATADLSTTVTGR